MKLEPNTQSEVSQKEKHQSVQFSHSVVYDSLWPHGLLHPRPPHPSPIPEVYSNSCPLSRWCHPTISSSVIPFSSRLQSFSESGAFQMSQFFVSGGVSASVLPMNIQDWFPLGLTGLISLQCKGLSRVFSNTTVQKNPFFSTYYSLRSNSHIHYMTIGKTIALTRWTFVGKVMSLLLNMLSRLVITFLPSGKHLLYYDIAKSLQMVTAAMKLKDTYSLEGKLWPIYITYSKAETLLCQQRFV